MKNTVRVGREKLADLRRTPNLADLIAAQYDELGPDAPLAPDWEAMQKLEDDGVLRVWTARVDGVLAGFLAMQVTGHLHYAGTKYALDGGHYLAPQYRDTMWRLWFRLWRAAERDLRAEGVQIMLAHDNIRHPLMPAFLSLGYEPAGVIYRKVL